MFIILEYNGNYVMGLMVKENGENETFDTREKAELFAKENCAFQFKIIEL
jgi:hypothetical protein